MRRLLSPLLYPQVQPYAGCISLVDLKVLICLAFSLPSGPYCLDLPPLSWYFLSSKWRNLMEISHLELNEDYHSTYYSAVDPCIYSHLLQKEVTLVITEQDTGLGS